MGAFVTASNVLCAGGRGTAQVMATVRAGISRIGNSHVMDRHFDPIQMGLVPEDALEPLPPAIDAAPLPSHVRRMLQLAAPTLAGLSGAVARDGGAATPVTLYVGLPRPGKQAEGWRERFLCDLGECAGLQVDPIHSRAFPNGRAGAIMALEAALQSLTEDAGRTVVVGGVDSFLNLRRIAELDLEGRILGPRVMDGFIPGEGAAFLVLKGAPDPTGSQVTLLGAAEVTDRGHRYGDDPAKGEGLANALTRMRDVLRSDHGPVRTTWAGFNGENFDAKLWGVARLRHADFFAPDMVMQHPADCIGDTGAAAGAILTALAEFGLRQSLRDGPALIWAASDHEDCGCALLGRDV